MRESKGGTFLVGMLVFVMVLFTLGMGRGVCSDNVHVGVRISTSVTEGQLAFVNARFEFVVTEFLGEDIRAMVQGPKLFLYRCIRGTWEGFTQFDWNHINACENMFCHHQGKRIKTIYNSWLMDGGDLVAPTSPDVMNHWINYYAVTASTQVRTYHYDGLFVDSAGHRLWPGAVNGKMPDGYSDAKWRDDRYMDLQFIKSTLPDKLVVFNGLHSDNGAEHSLTLTDGGMWETFAFRPEDGAYYGEGKWLEAIRLAEVYGNEKYICLVSKKAGFTEDVATRTFVFASYLLVSHPRVVLYISDLSYGTKAILYYPEYDVDLGVPLGPYSEHGGVYERRFEKGRVLVNPSADTARTASLGIPCEKVVPVGGGIVPPDGSWQGSLTTQPVSGTITLPPISGVVLKYR